MSLSRRQTLSIIGGGVVLAAAAGAYDVTRTPTKALAPWSMAGTYSDPRMNALSYAILSPNPHNRQPWLVDLKTPDQIGLYVDQSRLLPHTDPFSRQITIGLGCFLETLRMAAAEQGHTCKITPFPDGEDKTALDDRRVALVEFSRGGEVDPLFQHVMDRRTQKEPFDTERPVPEGMFGKLEGSVANGTAIGSSNEPELVATLKNISSEAFRIEFETPRTYKESVDLFRIGWREVNSNPDGLDFSGPMFEVLGRLGLFTREGSVSKESFSYKSGLEMVQANTETAMAHIWLVSKTNSRIDQINAGRDWMRLNLATTREGIGLHPLSQALQEFPEMSQLHRQVHDLLAPEGGTVQMLARLGYCAPVPQSPRWAIEEKLLSA